MFNTRSWLSLAALTLMAAGCAQTPMPTAPQAQAPDDQQAAATYSVQAVTTDPTTNVTLGRNRIGTTERVGQLGMERNERIGGLGMERGERMGRLERREDRDERFERFGRRRPVWWGTYGLPRTRILVNDAYILYGGYYYPYYVVGENVYPIYSMPYVLYGSTYVPYYLRRPILGPSYLGRRNVRFFRHRLGHRL